MYEDSKKGKKEQPFMKIDVAREILSPFQFLLFDTIFMLLKSFEVCSLYYLPVYEIINAN